MEVTYSLGKKISFRSDGIENEWNELENHINGTKSDFLRDCVVRQVRITDDLTELKSELKESELKLKTEMQYIENLKKKIGEIEENQRINAENELLIGEMMEIAKKVYENEGLTKERILAIAKDKIDPNLLANRLMEEGYDIGKERKIERQFVEDETGAKHEVREYVRKEKSPLEVLLAGFQRKYNPKIHGDNPIEYLEKNKDKYSQMCESFDDSDVTFDSFKEYLTRYRKS